MGLGRIAAVVLMLLAAIPGNSEENWERDFSVHLRPLLVEKCFVCHGGSELKLGELDLTTREAMQAGGASKRPALSPGDAEASMLYRAVTWEDAKLQMPPKENDRLTQEQVWKIRDWINAGAPWPDEGLQAKYVAASLEQDRTPEGVRVVTSGGLADEWTNRRYKPEDLWAFQPLQPVAVPDSDAANPIDAFHRASLREAGLAAAPPAARRTLLRRAFFDLTGLPPTAREAREFLDDDSPEAWEKLIDRLLDSPHYGERWGQHWLDIARYADTAGNSNDYERSNAWRYRDYVIRSFNNDKPYDRFVREQIAGDELSPDDPEMLIAVGFLRMGPWGSAMVPKAVARQAYLDDVVNSVGQVFLSTPLRCAKCHDHKFDPIPTRDYYRFYAAFAGTQMAERPAAYLPDENLARFEEGRAHVRPLLEFATERKTALEAKMAAAERRWYAERGQDFVPPGQRKDLPDSQKPPRHYGLDHEEEGRLKIRRQDEWIWTRRLERYEPLAQSVFNGPDYIPGNGRKLRIPAKLDISWRPGNAILRLRYTVRRAKALAPSGCKSRPANCRSSRKQYGAAHGRQRHGLKHSAVKGSPLRLSEHAGRNQMNAEQASKKSMRRPTRRCNGEGCQRPGSERARTGRLRRGTGDSMHEEGRRRQHGKPRRWCARAGIPQGTGRAGQGG